MEEAIEYNLFSVSTNSIYKCYERKKRQRHRFMPSFVTFYPSSHQEIRATYRKFGGTEAQFSASSRLSSSGSTAMI